MLNGESAEDPENVIKPLHCDTPEKTIGRLFRRSSRMSGDVKQKSPNGSDGPVYSSLVFIGSGGNEKMVLKESKLTEPNEGQIRIAVKFAGINFIDYLKKRGVYPKMESFPFVAGCEASGIVDAVGGSVTDFAVGDRVVLVRGSGCFSSSITTDADDRGVYKLPDNVSFEDAASIPLNYISAYDMLFNVASLKEGNVILVPQISGGVGHAVIQLSKLVPNVTIIGLSSKSKHEYLKSLGVQHLIDYATQDYAVEVRKICPEGVDIVLDSLNGEDSVKAWNLLRPFGIVVHYGMTSLVSSDRSPVKFLKGWFKCLSTNALKIITTNRKMAGYHLMYVVKENPAHVARVISKLLELLQAGSIKPHIDSIFPLAEGRNAFDRLQNRQNQGKILLSADSVEAKVFTANE